ncbi:hypothetical protein ACERII_24920 [Evansella sp. AB-rgal1]|uniref:hypothetical protein n=1 Tax=Evansella sp. AB-rgal1 TaxID=3242696 RepID=UPI00359D9F7F
MPKYRRKPQVVEAVKITRTITIESVEGTMTGNPGDYLITDPSGEQYPLKANVFEKTYEQVKGSKDIKQFIRRSLGKIKRKSKEIMAKN